MPNTLVDLTDTAEATAYLLAAGLAVPTALDAVITGVSAVMQSYASRNFCEQSYSVVVDGPGGSKLSLPNTPITAVSALAVDGVAVGASNSPTQLGYTFSETQVAIRGGRFCMGVMNVALTYTAGWPLASMPADIRRAACEGIAAVVAALDYDDPRAIEIAAGGTKMKFASGSSVELATLCLTPNVTAVLNQRRRVVPC